MTIIHHMEEHIGGVGAVRQIADFIDDPINAAMNG
jgi:hypothetical protein